MSKDENKPSGNVTRRGLLLKESREAKGLSIETVHEMTKIPLDVLHAIEEGYTVRMVSAYYFKGFIKMYAKFLGLEPQLVLDEPIVVGPEPAVSGGESPVPQKSIVNDKEHVKFNEFLNRQSKKQMVFGAVMGGLILFLGGIGYLVFANQAPKENHFVAPPVKKEQPKKKDPAPEKAKAKAKSAEEKPVKAAAVPEKKEPIVEKKTSARNTSKKVSLTVRSRVTGWLQIKVDGVVVFQSTMHEGTAETWTADKSIEISGKNINNLEFEVNGKVLGQLGKSDRGARRVIITSDGLSVVK